MRGKRTERKRSREANEERGLVYGCVSIHCPTVLYADLGPDNTQPPPQQGAVVGLDAKLLASMAQHSTALGVQEGTVRSHQGSVQTHV